jgi:CheY-like chemotaxis protein
MLDTLISKKMHILLIDDEPYNIMAFKLILRKHPQLKIEEAFNGQRAIEKVTNIKRICSRSCKNQPNQKDSI